MVQTRPIQSQPAMILEEEEKRYLVVTDLHIGFENTFLSNEIHVEPTELVQEAIDSLLSIMEYEKPDALVLLGDVKSGIDFISKTEWQAVRLFF